MLRASLLLSLLVLLSALSSPAPAQAIYHRAFIDEVMSGVGGDPDAQYVEIWMETDGQNLVDDTRLTIFNADGSAFTVLLLLQGNVPNGDRGGRWIMATEAFAALPEVQQAGFTPDFIFPPGILTPTGMLCWGAPEAPLPSENWNPKFPFFYTDCVAYGDYTGGDALHQPPSDLPPGDGTMSLQRVELPTDDGGDLNDWALRCPSPQNNAGQLLLLGPDDDADGLPNCHEAELGTDPNVVDTDQDGCADGEEAGLAATLGGQRDPTRFWDFLDVPAGTPRQRDQRVNIIDIAAIVLRFGTVSTPPTKPDALAEALTPPPDTTSYHTAYDRGGPIPGEDLWDLLPPDGAINIIDIGAAIIQFGHTCSASP